MSASLVGSEMCIRDSSMGARALLEQSPERQEPELPGHPAATRQNPTVEAVSYTHLTLPTICSV
eukprot:6335507-Alexandrium_andersonii.AAC.1